MTTPLAARRIHIRGVVQGVGFRPFVYRLARDHGLAGWVLNGDAGVEVHVEGQALALDDFVQTLSAEAPAAAHITGLEVDEAMLQRCEGFTIRDSQAARRPTTRISPDLPVCERCRAEMFEAGNRRRGYPYINCTECGPRYSIIRSLPYDRSRTTMATWTMCRCCAREYEDPLDRRFHAQPVACPACGPAYELRLWTSRRGSDPSPADPVAAAAALLEAGLIVAIKGIGGYHLACDAENPTAVAALRSRKYRKEQAFAVMVSDLDAAHQTCTLSPDAVALLRSPARPIVLAPRRQHAAGHELTGVAPDNVDLGVMLPYAPLHHLLFAYGAPARLVMTSGNRSSEPTAFRDEDARERLGGIADACLAGSREIARRVDDSIVRPGACGPVVLRRSRGLAPAPVTTLPVHRPVLAVGGDLKNTVTLVVDGAAYVSQHIGDLEHYDARCACLETIEDLLAMYGIDRRDLIVVHDRHPEYASTRLAAALPAARTLAVQHHRAHVASVLAEHAALDQRVVGVALDGTGYGDDGSIWGGELFAGSVVEGFERVGHLRAAVLPGGDAAARHPIQAAAGFVNAIDVPDLTRPPFRFPAVFERATALVRASVRTCPTTSAGRLFDTVAALLGFTRPITFEGQAAMWLEHLARRGRTDAAYPMPFDGAEIDWRPALDGIVGDRLAGIDPAVIARAFHRGLARGLSIATSAVLDRYGLTAVAVSGGVVQNDLLLGDFCASLAPRGVRVMTNHAVPPNDGGLSLGQAALAIPAVTV